VSRAPAPLPRASASTVQRRRAPEKVIEDPTGVVDQLVVVRVLQQRIVVGRVRGHQTDDAADEEPERRRALPGIDREPDRSREEEHVAQRVRDRHRVGQHGQTGEVDVRRDQEDPGQEADTDREDQRVDERGPIGAGCVALMRMNSPAIRTDRPSDRGHRRSTEADIRAQQLG